MDRNRGPASSGMPARHAPESWPGMERNTQLSDIMGVTGQAIVRAIVAGERNPAALARHHSKRLKASREEVL